MSIQKKLKLVEYIYEDIADNLFLFRKTIESNFVIINKATNKEREFTLEELCLYLGSVGISTLKIELMVDDILYQQAIYHKMLLDAHLTTLNVTISDINLMHEELKTALSDITRIFMTKRLTLVKDEE